MNKKCGYYSDGECNICGMGISGEDTFCRLCKDNLNCYYKQLSELKAKNERLKLKTEELENRIRTLDDENITVEITEDEFEEYKQLKKRKRTAKSRNLQV